MRNARLYYMIRWKTTSYSINSHSKVRKMRRQGLLEVAGIRKLYNLVAIMKDRVRTSDRRWPCLQSLSLLQSHIGGYSLGEVWERHPHSYSQNRGNEPVTATLFRKRQVFMLKVFWFPMKYSKSPQKYITFAPPIRQLFVENHGCISLPHSIRLCYREWAQRLYEQNAFDLQQRFSTFALEK